MPGVDAFIRDLPSQIVLGVLVNGVTAMLVWTGGQMLSSLRQSGPAAASGLGNAAGFVETVLGSALGIVSVNPLITLWRGLVWVCFVIGMLMKYLGTVFFLYGFFSAYFSQVDGATPQAIWVLPGLIVGALLIFRLGRILLGGIGSILTLPLFLYLGTVGGMILGYWLLMPCGALSSLFFDAPLGETYQSWLGNMPLITQQVVGLEESYFRIAGNLAYDWEYNGLAPIVVYLCLFLGLVFCFSVVLTAFLRVWNNLPPGKKLGAEHF